MQKTHMKIGLGMPALKWLPSEKWESTWPIMYPTIIAVTPTITPG